MNSLTKTLKAVIILLIVTASSLKAANKHSITKSLMIDTTIYVVHLPGITQLRSYSGANTTIIVDTALRGGLFVLRSGSVLYDNGINYPSAISGSYWQRQTQASPYYEITWWGVKPDSSQDNTVQIQQAINYVYANGGGTIHFIPGIYRGTNDTLRSKVLLLGYDNRGDTPDKLSATTVDTANVVKWCAVTSGIIVNTPPSISGGTVIGATCTMAGINGISFYGLGSAVPLIGVQLNSTRGFVLKNCNFNNISHSAIFQQAIVTKSQSETLFITNCFAHNCLLDVTPYSAIQGVFEIDGSDSRVENTEVSGGPNQGVSSNGHRACFAFRGADYFITNTTAEQGDINYYFGPSSKGQRGMGVNIKSDQSWKESIVIDGGSNIQLKGLIKTPCQLTNNLYSAVVVKSSATNVHLDLGLVTLATSNYCKYFVSDSTSITDISQKNSYNIWGASTNYTTAAFNILNAAGSSASLVNVNPNVIIDNTATPNVNAKGFIACNSGTTITNFTGGQTSQEITLLIISSTTINNGTGINLLGGATATFSAGTALKFINYNGTWYQEGQPLSGGGTSYPAYSMLANNTGSASAPSSVVYKDIAEQPYTSTVTWIGTTAPAGTTAHIYRWSQVGHLVTLEIILSYSTAGTANTAVTMALPADCPSPALPSNVPNSAGNTICWGIGRMAPTLNIANVATTSVQLRVNATSTGYELYTSQNSSNPKYVWLTIQYYSN